MPRHAWNLRSRLLGFGLLVTALACGESSRTNGPPGAGATQESQRQERMTLLNQQLAQLQEKAAQLDRKIADLQVEHDRRLREVTALSQELTAQIAQTKAQLSGASGTAVARTTPAGPSVIFESPSPVPTAPPTDQAASAAESQGGSALVRIVLIVIILVAIWFFYKLFMGRWEGVEDDELDGEEALDEEDEIYRTDAGTVRISPQARASSDESDGAPDEHPEH